ncbi:hypothetical protein ACFXA3_27990 [Streptomyces sp. NPDC059456]|uniref:hypothetical protein n=1 Tax=Streptomyces sp. NPDC059456 TaxID=3346838 RepID=UPI0036D01EDB
MAVKALHGVEDHDRDRLRKEVEAWSRVAPFCTTTVLHADLDGAVPYVVSEYVAGPDLRRAVTAGGPCGPQERRRLAIGVATAPWSPSTGPPSCTGTSSARTSSSAPTAPA